MTARFLVLLSGFFLLLQVAETDYGTQGGGREAAGFWFVVGAALLWLVYRRRSRFARGVVVVLSLFGAIVYGVVTVAGADGHAAFLAISHLGQALPLLTGPVRRHVGLRQRDPGRLARSGGPFPGSTTPVERP